MGTPYGDRVTLEGRAMAFEELPSLIPDGIPAQGSITRRVCPLQQRRREHGNPAYDHLTNVGLHLANGVSQYWILSWTARTLARWRAGKDRGELLTGRVGWRPPGMAQPFVFDLPAFFDDALG